MSQGGEFLGLGVKHFHGAFFIATDDLELAVRQKAQRGTQARHTHDRLSRREDSGLGVEYFPGIQGGAPNVQSARQQNLPILHQDR